MIWLVYNGKHVNELTRKNQSSLLHFPLHIVDTMVVKRLSDVRRGDGAGELEHVKDFDMASYGVVKVFDDRHGHTYPEMPWEPKVAFTTLADYYCHAMPERSRG